MGRVFEVFPPPRCVGNVYAANASRRFGPVPLLFTDEEIRVFLLELVRCKFPSGVRVAGGVVGVVHALGPEGLVAVLATELHVDFEVVRLEVGSGRGKSAAQQYGIVGQPTFIFFDGSDEEVRRLMGPQDASLMEFEIERLIEP